ncbi:MAG: hypothetical protein HYX88_02580 [Chloroflexi bacterium]|nr:hypothetical protein [Chloroflexota bacterium]
MAKIVDCWRSNHRICHTDNLEPFGKLSGTLETKTASRLWKGLARSQEGQILAIALIAMIFGAIVIAPFLQLGIASLESSARTGGNLQAYYAAEAGVEDAIWKVRYGDVSAAGLVGPGDSTSYTLTQPINGYTVTVSVARTRTDFALDDFESGAASGGAGWLGPWTTSGAASWVQTGIPYRGNYHLRLSRDTGYVERGVNLSGLSGMHLQFWAKAGSFLAGETAALKVGPAGSLATVKTWTSVESDETYHFYDIDLSPYSMTSDFRVAFQAGMVYNRGDFYVDNVQFVRALPTALYGLPLDDFELGSSSGGSGWLNYWNLLGDAGVVATGSPHGGSYHLQLRRGNGVATRRADLLGLAYLRAQFWAKASSFEPGETATFEVSSDGQTWNTAKTWTAADADDTYHFSDIDLSPYTFSKPFYIRFSSHMSAVDDLFFMDDFKIVGPSPYEILSTTGTFPIRAMVMVRGEKVVILSWKVG